MKLPLFLIVFALPQLGAANFHGFNFNNFSYPYRFWNGRNVQVPLQNGKHEYDIKIDRGFFRLAHFYVADVTGDGRPEAIVVLWHLPVVRLAMVAPRSFTFIVSKTRN